jgi:chemotaxis protein MotB
MSTNLMLFFLMLFAMTRMTDFERLKVIEGMERAVNKAAIEEQEEKERQEKSAMRLLQDTIAHGKLKKYAKVDIDERSVKLTLDLPVFFQLGSADLTSSARNALKRLVTPLKKFPNEIIIEGHTDNIPIHGGRYPSNWELSVARAVSVIDFFTERGIAQKKMVAGGYGEYHPLYPNDTKANRAKNRRIEITILRQPKT